MKKINLKNIVFCGRCLLSFSVLIYLFTLLNNSNLSTVVLRTNIAYAWIAPLLILLSLYFAAIRWHVLLSSFKIYQSISQSFRLYLVGSFYSVVLPGVIGGDAIRISLSSLSHKQYFGEITLSVLIERILGFVVLLVLGSFSTQVIPQYFTYRWGTSITHFLYITASIFSLIIIIVYSIVQLFPKVWLIEKKDIKSLNILIKFLLVIKRITAIQLIVMGLGTALSQSSDIIASFVLAQSLGVNLPLSTFFVVIPIIYIATLLPISLGGLGVREGVLTYLLSQIGVVPADAVICSLLIYINRLLVSLIGGVIQLFGKV